VTQPEYWLTAAATIAIAASAVATLYSNWNFRRWVRRQGEPKPVFINGIVRRSQEPHGFETELEIGNLGDSPLFVTSVRTWFWVGNEWVPNEWKALSIEKGMIKPRDGTTIVTKSVLYGDTLEWYKECTQEKGIQVVPEEDDVKVGIDFICHQEGKSMDLENCKILWDQQEDAGHIVPSWIWKRWRVYR